MATAKLLKSICMLVLVGLAAISLWSCTSGNEEGQKYFCPMHPNYISDRPGDCPICNMRLVPMEDKPAGQAGGAGQGEHTMPEGPGDQKGQGGAATQYTCPMDPEVISDKPGRCPKCGMNLEPKKEDAPATSSEETHAGHTPSGERKLLYYRNPMDPTVTSPTPMKDPMGMDYVPVYSDEVAGPSGKGVDGMAPIEVTPAGLSLAGVQTATATREPLVRIIRTVGYVVPDETRVRHVHTKISGWIEKLEINFTGQLVEKGVPILTIYSPELLASQQQYLIALENQRRTANPPANIRDMSDELIQKARRRLELFDVTPDFIKELERTKTPKKTVTLTAPVSGFVTAKGVFDGMQVEPGMEMFTVTDLSEIWVEANFYEYEAQFVKLGQKATLSLPYGTTSTFTATVSYIYPTVNPEARTLRVRFDIPNADLALKPAMYVDVDLEVEAQEEVVVPDSAILDSGRRQVVFVALGGGKFEPREVTVGLRESGKVQVLSGVTPGEQVVTRANFLLDSESRLRAAFSAVAPSKSAAPTESAAPSEHAGH